MADTFHSPNSREIATVTTLDSLFSDDFGGSAVNLNLWDVLDGGLGANPTLGNKSLTQGAIGSGITGITDAVSTSNLVITMPTTNGAERWYLSKRTFAGKEDIFLVASKSQSLAANSVFVGLVEVDPGTGIPLLNPNIAADGNGSSDFTNRGGVELGLSATATAFFAEAIGDSSSAKTQGATGVAGAAWTTAQECLVEIDSRDIIVSTATMDNVAAKAAGASRVSSQCPNDTKLYKLVIRCRNTTVAASPTTVTIKRILVIDNYEQRVQISTGEGDQIGAKALAVNILSITPTANVAVTSTAGSVSDGVSTFHHITSAATTNATSVKATAGVVKGGYLRNRAASEKYFKFFNKASAPTVGTDTPVLTIGIPASDKVNLAEIVGSTGARFTLGIAYAITGAYTDLDNTAVAASDVDVNLVYV